MEGTGSLIGAHIPVNAASQTGITSGTGNNPVPGEMPVADQYISGSEPGPQDNTGASSLQREKRSCDLDKAARTLLRVRSNLKGAMIEHWSTQVAEEVNHHNMIPLSAPGNGIVFAGPAKVRYDMRNKGILGIYDPENGELRWKYETAGELRGAPAIKDDGTIFTADTEGNIYALDCANKRELWKGTIDGDCWNTPSVGPDDTLYVPTAYDGVYAIDGAKGKEKWHFGGCGKLASTPVTDPGNTTVFCGDDDGNLFALSIKSGKKKWSIKTGGWTNISPPMLNSRGTLVVVSENGDHVKDENYIEKNSTVYGLDPGNGKKLWECKAGCLRSHAALLGDDTLIAGTLNGKLQAIDTRTGEMKWEKDFGKSVDAIAAGPGDTLYMILGEWPGGYTTHLAAFDLKERELLWENSYDKDRYITLSVGKDHTIFAADFEGKLHALRDIRKDALESPEEDNGEIPRESIEIDEEFIDVGGVRLEKNPNWKMLKRCAPIAFLPGRRDRA